MCNCNQKRQQLNGQHSANHDNGLKQVMLLQKRPLKIYGDVTGRAYKFLSEGSIIWVDSADALLMTSIKGIQVL